MRSIPFLVVALILANVEAFLSRTCSSRSPTCLFSSPQRKARRDLKKRKRRRRGKNQVDSITSSPDDTFWETAESRPLIATKEKGEDYWMDPEELKRAQEREIRERSVGQVPDEKLWKEVLSPYKQNWIGLISVTIIALAFIIKTFPELVENPTIALPDL